MPVVELPPTANFTIPRGLMPGSPTQIPGANNIVRFPRPGGTPDIKTPQTATTDPTPNTTPATPGAPSTFATALANRYDLSQPHVNPYFPLFGPPILAPNESLSSPAREPDYSPQQYIDYGSTPNPPNQYRQGSKIVTIVKLRVGDGNGNFSIYTFPKPYVTNLYQGSASDNQPPTLITEVDGSSYLRDIYGQRSPDFGAQTGIAQTGEISNPNVGQIGSGTAAPTAPAPEKTPDLPDTLPNTIPDAVPESPFEILPTTNPAILPFRRAIPSTPDISEPETNPQQEPEPTPSPAPNPAPEPDQTPAEPSDPTTTPTIAPTEDPKPTTTPTPSTTPTTTPSTTPQPGTVPSTPTTTPSTPTTTPVTLPTTTPDSTPTTTPDSTPTPTPSVDPTTTPTPNTPTTPTPSTTPTTTPTTTPSPSQPPDPTPTEDPKPVVTPTVTPDPAVPSDPSTNPATPPSTTPNPSTTPTTNPNTTPDPGEAIPLELPNNPSNPTTPTTPLPSGTPLTLPSTGNPTTSPITVNPSVPVSPASVPSTTTTLLPTSASTGSVPITPTVVDSIPTGTKSIPSPLSPGGLSVPSTGTVATPATSGGAIEPCKNDPCLTSISDTVKSNNTAANTASTAAAAAVAALTPVPTPVKVFTSCNGETAVFGIETIMIPTNSVAYVGKLFEKIANIEAQKCIEQTAIASVPEWWQIRPEAHRPQMIYIYRVKNANGTWASGGYSLTVPHPKQTTAASVVKLPNYTKGNYQSILTLSDNSKVIVNGKDAAACTAMINAAKAQIADSYLTNASTKSGVRGGATVFAEKAVTLWAIDYYAKGSFGDMKPDWRKLVK